ncbi:hypothetical protein P9112_003964 [Eukaryota sp. TZLM1-RC]
MSFSIVTQKLTESVRLQALIDKHSSRYAKHDNEERDKLRSSCRSFSNELNHLYSTDSSRLKINMFPDTPTISSNQLRPQSAPVTKQRTCSKCPFSASLTSIQEIAFNSLPPPLVSPTESHHGSAVRPTSAAIDRTTEHNMKDDSPTNLKKFSMLNPNLTPLHQNISLSPKVKQSQEGQNEGSKISTFITEEKEPKLQKTPNLLIKRNKSKSQLGIGIKQLEIPKEESLVCNGQSIKNSINQNRPSIPKLAGILTNTLHSQLSSRSSSRSNK